MDRDKWERLIRIDIRVIYLYHYTFSDTLEDMKKFEFILKERIIFENAFVETSKGLSKADRLPREQYSFWNRLTFGDYDAIKMMTKAEILESLSDEAKDLLKDPSYDLR